MGRERVGDPRQTVDEQAGQGRMGREVAMHVTHAVALHQTGRVDDLREDPEPADQEVRAAPGPGDHRPDGAEVASRGPTQERPLAGQDRQRHERQIGRPGDVRGRLRMHRRLALVQEREQPDVDPLALHRRHLEQDERLGQLREAGHDVGDPERRRAAAAGGSSGAASSGTSAGLASRSPWLRPDGCGSRLVRLGRPVAFRVAGVPAPRAVDDRPQIVFGPPSERPLGPRRVCPDRRRVAGPSRRLDRRHLSLPRPGHRGDDLSDGRADPRAEVQCGIGQPSPTASTARTWASARSATWT